MHICRNHIHIDMLCDERQSSVRIAMCLCSMRGTVHYMCDIPFDIFYIDVHVVRTVCQVQCRLAKPTH